MDQYLVLYVPLPGAWIPKLLGLVVAYPEEPLAIHAPGQIPSSPTPKDIVPDIYEPPIEYKDVKSVFNMTKNSNILARIKDFFYEYSAKSEPYAHILTLEGLTVLRYEMVNQQHKFQALMNDESYALQVRNLILRQRTESAYFITGFMVVRHQSKAVEQASVLQGSSGVAAILPQEPVRMSENDEDMIFAVTYQKLKLEKVPITRRKWLLKLFRPLKNIPFEIAIDTAFRGRTQIGLLPHTAHLGAMESDEGNKEESVINTMLPYIPPLDPEGGSGSSVSNFISIVPSQKDIFIAIMGVSGSGKSTFISHVCPGVKDIIGHDLRSYTSEIRIYSLKIEGRNVHLIDTPGFDDSNRSDTEIITMIGQFFVTLAQKNCLLSGVIYLQRISDKRITGSAQRSISMLEKFLGTSNLSSVIFVTTFWDVVPWGDGEETEYQLRDIFWNKAIAQGSRVMRHDGTKSSALGIIRAIMHTESKFLLKFQRRFSEESYLDVHENEMATSKQKRLVSTNSKLADEGISINITRSGNRASDERNFILHDISRATFIAIMGPTGVGKSNFIQKASGNMDIRIGHGLASETQRVQFVEFYHDNDPIVLIDTPGFNDTYRSEVDILEEISTSLAITYRQDVKLAGVIYIQSILDPRMQASAVRNITIFNKLCGENPLKKVTLVTSFWDEVELDIGITREEELKESFWEGKSFADSRMYRFFNDSSSATRVLESMTLEAVVLNIQREVVEDKYDIIETEAGRFLNEELVALNEEFVEKLAIIQKKYELAEREHDESRQKEFLDQGQKIEQSLAEFQRQQGLLKENQISALVQFEKGWDQKLQSLQAECKAKEAERASLEQQMNEERAAASEKLLEMSERANNMVEQIKMLSSKNEVDRAWYEKRIQDLLEIQAGEYSGSQSGAVTKNVNETQLNSWLPTLMTTASTLKGFVDQANRFFAPGDESGSVTHHHYRGLTAKSCAFLQLMSCFECDIVPIKIFLRACSPRRRWSSAGEIVMESPRHTLVPTWLIDIFDGVREPYVEPPELLFALKEGMLEVTEKESVPYYRLSAATKIRERDILTTSDHRNALFNLTSILIYSLPSPFTEMLWDETLWHCKEVVETTCRPFLSVVSISDLEDYLAQFPPEFKTRYLIQLLYFILDDSFYRNLTIPPLAFQVVQLAKQQSSNADVDLAEVVGIRMLRDLFVQSFKAGIAAEKIMLVAKEAYCLNERMNALLALTIDFLQRSAMTQSAREELADLASNWTPYREDHISTMELITQTLISTNYSEDWLQQFQNIDLQLRTATGFALSQRQHFHMARLILERCIKGIESIYSRTSHEYVTTSVELVHACNVIRDKDAGEKWALRALPMETRAKSSKSQEIILEAAQMPIPTDFAALQLSLADTFIGQGRYVDARGLLTDILKEKSISDYMTIVCSLRLNKVYRRMGAKKELELSEDSPLCIAIRLLANADDSLKAEFSEELGCTLSVLQQGNPRDVTEFLPLTIRESYAMSKVLEVHSSLLTK